MPAIQKYPIAAYVEYAVGRPLNPDMMLAIQGLDYLGIHAYPFTYDDILSDKYRSFYKNSLFVGSAKSMRAIFTRLGVQPESIDYPPSLLEQGFMGRAIRQQLTQDAVLNFRMNQQPFFIKSFHHKVFSGILIREDRQLSYLEQYHRVNAWVSEPMSFQSEWRCFVHKGQLVDARPYQGDFRCAPDYNAIAAMISAYTDAPVAYTLDVGINDAGKTFIVEVNDFWAIDSFGLEAERYAQMLIDRYRQITQIGV